MLPVMFSTLLGPMPRPPLPPDAPAAALLEAVLAAQTDAGFEPLTDAGWSLPELDPVEAWQATQSRTPVMVKAVLTGPVSAGLPVGFVRATVEGLAAAGCRWIEIHEPAAVEIGADEDARRRFVTAHRALTADVAGIPDVHMSLAIVGGAADGAGIEALLAGAYASLAVDLIDGPDNWRLIAAAPGDRGIVCGAMSARPDADESPELLLYAAGYAASTGGRGAARVGLATSGSMAALAWEVAVRRMARLGEAARLIDATPAERRDTLDPRAIDIRSAALGRAEPPSRRSRRGRPPQG